MVPYRYITCTVLAKIAHICTTASIVKKNDRCTSFKIFSFKILFRVINMLHIDVHPLTSGGTDEAITFLDFDQDDMNNTTIHICGNTNGYIICTIRKTMTIYHCQSNVADDNAFITVEQRLLGLDLITFANEQPINLSNCLKTPLLSIL